MIAILIIVNSNLVALAVMISTIIASTANVRVVDGDTIEVSSITYRLHGIDAPEAGQKCAKGTDSYRRVIGVCNVDGRDLNAAMVASGNAWAFREYSKNYVAQENEASSARRGVLQSDTQKAKYYRAAKWAVGLQKTPDACPIKGNISRKGRIYLAPWSPWYSQTKVSVNKGERWFCSESDALYAGWRTRYWGR